MHAGTLHGFSPGLHGKAVKGINLVTLFYADTPAAKAWLAAQQQALKTSQSAQVLARLAAAGEPAEVPEEHAPTRCAQRYLANRPDQLDYAALAADLPIGSGMIEAGHHHVLHARLKVSGAWWKRENAEAMLQTRVCQANGQWAASWKTSHPCKTTQHF